MFFGEKELRYELDPRQQAIEDYAKCREAGNNAYKASLGPMEAYKAEILDIERTLRRCMETAEAGLRPLVEAVAVVEAQAREAYMKAFEEEKLKLKRK